LATRRRTEGNDSKRDVMKESVTAAVSRVRANAGRDTDLHVHAQSAAETRDGGLGRGGAGSRC